MGGVDSFFNWGKKAPEFPQPSYDISQPKPQDPEMPAQPKGTNLEPAILLIKEFEGLRLKAYLDPVGIPTIGYGTTEGVQLGQTITRDEAEKLLMNDILKDRLPWVEKVVTVPISDNELCALISFTYNVGNGALKNSTLLKMLNEGKPRDEVADQFDRWNKAGGQVLKGLVRRRTAEKALFLKPDLVPMSVG